jgi:antitoxin (DNA-binding transcriptional repressor) of toxin-antitoxin stability system
MKEVGAFEAKNTLSALLDLVERGEERQVIDGHGLVSTGGPVVESTFRHPSGRHGACA